MFNCSERSNEPFIRGFIVKENCDYPSNWRNGASLSDYLKKNNIVGLEGIDTRKLVRHIREKGAMRGIISSTEKKSFETALPFSNIINKEIIQMVEFNELKRGDKYLSKEEFESKFIHDKGEYRLAIKSGTIEMKENKVIVLAD